jgi:hypothetical protein
MTDAAIGYGMFFELETAPGAGTFLRIAEVTSITPPNEKTDTLDATNTDSPDGYMEFIMGMTDPGECSFEMNFLPGSASETRILAAKATRQAHAAKITMPGAQVWSFDVLMTGYAPAMPVKDKMTATVTGKVTGSVARA